MNAPKTSTISYDEKNRLFAEARRLFDRARLQGLITLKKFDPNELPVVRPKRSKLKGGDGTFHNRNTPKKWPLSKVVEAVAEAFGVSREELFSDARHEPLVTARNSGYRIARSGGYSWQDCASAFNRGAPQSAMGGAVTIDIRLSNELDLSKRYQRALDIS